MIFCQFNFILQTKIVNTKLKYAGKIMFTLNEVNIHESDGKVSGFIIIFLSIKLAFTVLGYCLSL